MEIYEPEDAHSLIEQCKQKMIESQKRYKKFRNILNNFTNNINEQIANIKIIQRQLHTNSLKKLDFGKKNTNM